jgi:hypothetical protein
MGRWRKLAPRGGEQILARRDQPLGDRPRAGILRRPERPAGMDEQHLRLRGGLAMEDYARGIDWDGWPYEAQEPN